MTTSPAPRAGAFDRGRRCWSRIARDLWTALTSAGAPDALDRSGGPSDDARQTCPDVQDDGAGSSVLPPPVAGVLHTGAVDPRPALGVRAREIGHDLQIEHDVKRFRIACSCGWTTALGWKRKTAFQAATDHLLTALHQAEAPDHEATG